MSPLPPITLSDVIFVSRSRVPHSLRQLAICLAMLAALLPSMMLLLPAAHGQPLAMGEHCDMAGMTGHVQAPGSHDPTPDQYHECHCLLCVVHAVDIGLPPSVVQWQQSGRADVVLAQTIYPHYASTVWLVSEPRGPPAFS
ncbi:DUF2946 family protein [Pseudomonas batumici]|uniref:DUF2946 family protein n=1 Tax=Pseudomonas batumici TaxID=226910 RepID=UPI001427CECA|nr:DUF2946 family protein [Pseudomonas batumici]